MQLWMGGIMANSVQEAEKLVGREETSQVIKNSSDGYNYHYASLADMAKQGVKIPKMRIKVIEGTDYLEYFDGTDWQLGAKIVLPRMASANDAQIYGAACTYARRLTTAMANAIATEDDTEIETKPKTKAKPERNSFDFNFNECRKQVQSATSIEELNMLYETVPEKLRKYVLNDFSKRKGEIQ